MSTDVLGPASTNAVTSRPSSTTSYGTADTWFKPCSSAAAQDGTQITSDWLNLILAQFRDAVVGSGIVQDNGDDMLWRVFEVMAPRYADDTGAANALVITNTPPVPAMRAGLVLAVKVAHTNTTASTVTFDGETAVPIVNWVDASALAAGALVGGGVALMVGDDAGNMRLINSALSGGGGGGGGGSGGGGFAGQYTNLIGSAPGGTKTASWTVEELSAEVTLGGTAYKGANLTLNFNGATTGANGMDTGSTPTSADLAIYAIYNPTTTTWATLGCLPSASPGAVSGSVSPVYGGANMPAGYTASALIWVGKTDAGPNIIAFRQLGHEVEIAPALLYAGGTTITPSGGAVNTWRSVSIAASVPAAAVAASGAVLGYAIGPGPGAGPLMFGVAVASTAAGIGAQQNFVGDAQDDANTINGPIATCQFSRVALVTAQEIFVNWVSANWSEGAGAWTVSGYTF
jgi:hypothetical protein